MLAPCRAGVRAMVTVRSRAGSQSRPDRETYGERFTPPESLVARAKAGEADLDGGVLAAA